MSNVRRLLQKQKQERASSSRVNHPFAKYDDKARLMCIVCNSPVKNDSVWQAHLGSSQHRQQLERLKALKQKKRPAPAEPEYETKRAKVEVSDLPADFFDNQPMDEDAEEQGMAEESSEEEDHVEEPVEESKPNTIPAGFFDDPEQEAKAQHFANEQAKLAMEKGMNEFHETMMQASVETREIEEEDDETLYADRNQDIFEEQALLDARVEKLKQMRQTKTAKSESKIKDLFVQKQAPQTQSMFDDDESSDEDE